MLGDMKICVSGSATQLDVLKIRTLSQTFDRHKIKPVLRMY